MNNIRGASESDAVRIAEIEQEVFDDPWSLRSISMYCSPDTDSNYTAWVVETDGCVVAYLLFSSVLVEGSIDRIAVVPEARRRGTARRLMTQAIEYACTRGITDIWLEVAENNEKALTLYELSGFVAISRRKGYYQGPENLDAIVMQRKVGVS